MLFTITMARFRALSWYPRRNGEPCRNSAFQTWLSRSFLSTSSGSVARSGLRGRMRLATDPPENPLRGAEVAAPSAAGHHELVHRQRRGRAALDADVAPRAVDVVDPED